MDGYGVYRKKLNDEVTARANEMNEFDREMVRAGDEMEVSRPGLFLGAGRIAREIVLSGLRRRSGDPMERALQAAHDRLAREMENDIVYGRERARTAKSTER